MIPYYLEPAEFPGLYKTKAWGTYTIPRRSDILRVNVDSLGDLARIILLARKDLPPETFKSRLNKMLFKLNYHFKGIFK